MNARADQRIQSNNSVSLRRRITVEIRVPDQQAAEQVTNKLRGLTEGATTSGAQRLAAGSRTKQVIVLSQIELVDNLNSPSASGRRALARDDALSGDYKKMQQEMHRLESENEELRRQLAAALAASAQQC